MRTLTTFDVIHTAAKSGSYDGQVLSPHQPRHLPPAAVTGWKSPVPYLFGGLAAMLGLIAFALLILACSYWKLSGHLDSEENDGHDGGDDDGKLNSRKALAVEMNNSVLVIMAGEDNPTFLATPATSRTTSFGDTCSCSSSSGGGNGDDGDEKEHKVVELMTTTTTTTVPTEVEKR